MLEGEELPDVEKIPEPITEEDSTIEYEDRIARLELTIAELTRRIDELSAQCGGYATLSHEHGEGRRSDISPRAENFWYKKIGT